MASSTQFSEFFSSISNPARKFATRKGAFVKIAFSTNNLVNKINKNCFLQEEIISFRN
jgi:hypothetical protein